MIGAGKVGTVLGLVFVERGDRIVSVISRTSASARRAGRYLGCRSVATTLTALPEGVDLLLIATPHAAVAEVVRDLASLPGRSFRGVAVCHASGMLTSSVLEPLRRRGATVFSFHPLQTFPRSYPPGAILASIPGITYGVDGSSAALRAARVVARRLGGRVLTIPPERRELYHAACVVASNHLTALMRVLEEMAGAARGTAGAWFPAFAPIIAATLRNNARTGPTGALSGPVARGGLDTVDRHCIAVRTVTPHLFPIFSALTLETIRLARRKGSITERRAQEMVALIRRHLRAHARREETT